MAQKRSNDVFDGLTTLEGGVNSGVVPALVRENQLSFAANATLRGGYATSRAMFHHRPLDFGGNAVMENRFRTGRWQGGETYQSDNGQIYLIWVIGGRVYRITPGPISATVQEVTPTVQTVTTAPFIVPGIGSTVNISVVSTANINAGYEVEIAGHNYVVTVVIGPTDLTVKNVDDIPGAVINSGAIFIFWDLNPASRPHAWLWQSEKWMIINDGQSIPIFFDGATARRSNPLSGELTAGRMGVYWKGRNWWVNPDGRTFRAGDLVYSSSSGTAGEQFRDAVLKQTHNAFLTSGQFSVPANAGEIAAMKAVANLDTSLGQGPLQVSTATTIFNCDAPADEFTWNTTVSVLLSVSQIEGGALSQYSTVVANGDLFYRSFAGIQTLILGRRDFQQRWGNKPVSREMNRILSADNQVLLEFSTAIVFDNRLLMSASPTVSDRGVYHRAVIALDFDILSTLQGSPPPVYDGGWTGLQVLQFMKGTFGSKERCFAASFNNGGEIDLFEIMPSGAEFADTNNGLEYPVVWSLETGDMFKKTGNAFERARLADGEIYVDDIRGRVDIRVFYRPDQYPCWVFWHGWSVCAQQDECLPDPFTCMSILNAQPQYRVRMGFGEPTPKNCDPITNKPFREFYTCQVRVLLQGWCRINGLKLRAVLTDEPEMAPMMCEGPNCDVLPEQEPEPNVDVTGAWLTHENDYVTVDDDTYFQIA